MYKNLVLIIYYGENTVRLLDLIIGLIERNGRKMSCFQMNAYGNALIGYIKYTL